MKTNLTAELTTQALKNPALAGIDPSELRQRVLNHAQLQLLQAMTDGASDRELIDTLLSIIKSLSHLELKEKDMVEKRALTETIRLNREELRQQERRAKAAQESQKNTSPASEPANAPASVKNAAENPLKNRQNMPLPASGSPQTTSIQKHGSLEKLPTTAATI